MAKCSRKKRKQIKSPGRKAPSKPVMAPIARAIWTSVQVVLAGISIYQLLDPSTKSIIEGVFSQATQRFMADTRSLPHDEQIVQAGKLIAAQREIGKWLGQNKLPPFQNSFDKASLAKGLENLLLDGVAMSQEELQNYCAKWLGFWAVSSSAQTKDPEQPPPRRFRL